VRLDLPETGVCSGNVGVEAVADGGCCGGPAPATVDACCVKDADVKEAGRTGCGCSCG
jgi:hypothetical protein